MWAQWRSLKELPGDIQRMARVAKELWSISWKEHRKLLLLRVLFMVIGGITGGCMTLAIAEIEANLASFKQGDGDLDMLVFWICAMPALYVLLWSMSSYRTTHGWFVAAEHDRQMGYCISARLRKAQATLTAEALEDPNICNLSEKAHQNSESINSFLDSFFGTSFASMSAIVAGIILLWKDPLIALLVGTGSIIWLAAAMYWGHATRQVQEKIAEPSRRLQSYEELLQSRDSLLELRVLRAIPRFLNLISHLWRYRDEEQRKVDRAIINPYRLAGFVGAGVAAFTLGRSVLAVIQPGSDLGPGYVFLLMSCMSDFFTSAEFVGTNLGTLWKDTLLTEDIFEFERIARQNSTAQTSVDSLESTIETIEFRDVRFCYPFGEFEILQGVTLQIQQGEKIALVGKNGSGKSTFLNLLLGHYQPSAGRILINGRDLRSLNQDDYFALVGYMPQEYANISLPVNELISLSKEGEENNLSALRRAAEEATAADFIEMMPQKYLTMLGREFYQSMGVPGERGVRPSEGQSQRLRIATAVFSDAPLLIFDESTSMVDAEEAEQIVTNLLAREQNTVIFVSHRFDNVRRCGRILVLEDGVIVGDGSHEELLTTCSLYSSMYTAQARYYED